MLTHSLFEESADAEAGYEWVCSSSERAMAGSEEKAAEMVEEAVDKIYTIFLERSAALFADDSTLLWLREIVGFVL
jgi:inosine/xanthosine triphosphate pyrophosphatase family protein